MNIYKCKRENKTPPSFSIDKHSLLRPSVTKHYSTPLEGLSKTSETPVEFRRTCTVSTSTPTNINPVMTWGFPLNINYSKGLTVRWDHEQSQAKMEIADRRQDKHRRMRPMHKIPQTKGRHQHRNVEIIVVLFLVGYQLLLVKILIQS